MMNLKFDSRGNLEPYEISQLDLETFKVIFRDSFPSETSRYTLFPNFEVYLEDFKKMVPTAFKCWIDGSFISNKPNPADVDVVIILNYQTILENEDILYNRFMGKNSLAKYGVDGYLIYDYPTGHSKRFITEYDMAYWIDFFGKTRANRNKKQFPKGFIEIQFEN